MLKRKRMLKRKEREDETFEQLKRQLLVRPDSAPLHYNLGLAHGRRKEWDEAITEFKTALELNPGLEERDFDQRNKDYDFMMINQR